MKDTYFSVQNSAEGSFRDKGSRFLSFVFPCQNEEEVRKNLDILRKKYFDATHHCYAYRLGFEGDKFRANDDGEPNGSAGMPILGQIRSKNLTFVLIVVVRYYGGTKLGVSGLINAYKESAADALNYAEIVEKIIYDELNLTFEYEKMNLVMSAAKKYDLIFQKQDFDNICHFSLLVRRALKEKVMTALYEFLEKNEK